MTLSQVLMDHKKHRHKSPVFLNNYNLHSMRIRNNKAKFAFFAIMAGINIHLDSWINVE